MSQTNTEYKARYPKMHADLLDAYKKAMEKGADPLFIERVIGIIDTLSAFKKDGGVSVESTRNFHADVDNIVDIVGKQIRPEDMSKGQRFLAFGMENIRKAFGGQ